MARQSKAVKAKVRQVMLAAAEQAIDTALQTGTTIEEIASILTERAENTGRILTWMSDPLVPTENRTGP